MHPRGPAGYLIGQVPVFACAWFLFAAVLAPLPAQPTEAGYRTEDAFPGLTFIQPLGLASAPGETQRLFVVEKPGRIQAVTGLGGTPVKQLFFDLTSRVLASASSEEGLLGLAFHPNFAANRFFYVFYTVDATTAAGTGRHNRLSRFTALAAPATNTDILATEVPLISQFDRASNHNGGDLHFGTDGYLYVALGDEGGGNDQYNNSQRIDLNFFAGLLRIDVDRRPGNPAPNSHPAVHAGTYAVPADNPFVGATSFNGAAVTPANVRTEFWAIGLRNPWRFTIDAPTGRIILGDVGQSAREEINLIVRGGNYGWAYREGAIAGPRPNPPAGVAFVDPIWDAGRDVAASITGGVVYRGQRFPQLSGRYVFGDFIRNRIFAMSFPASGPVQVVQIASESNPAGFGIDPSNGDVLIASLGPSVIRRLVRDNVPDGILAHPVDQIVTTGFDVALSAAGEGTLQWQVSTDGGATWNNLANNATYGGVTTGTLTISSTSAALNGHRYRLTATRNGVTSVSTAATLTVAPAFFPFATGIAAGTAGDLLVTDASTNTVRRVNAAGQVSLVAGTAGASGSTDGTGAAARFNQPGGIVAAADGTLGVADTANATVRRISPAGVVTTLAGSPSAQGNADGTGAAATFASPTGLAFDSAGRLVVADAMNNTVRRITSAGAVTTQAGSPGSAGSADGAGSAARFNHPTGVAIDAAGNVFVADSGNNTVRRIAPNGTVTTFAGLAGVSGSEDGTGSGALFNQPRAVTIDGGGVLYVADTGNSTIRRVSPAGVVTTLAGLPGVSGHKDGTGSGAWFNKPQALVVDANGSIQVADTGNAALRRVTTDGRVTTILLTQGTDPAPPPPPPPQPPPGNGTSAPQRSGGGSIGPWFAAILSVLSVLRFYRPPSRYAGQRSQAAVR